MEILIGFVIGIVLGLTGAGGSVFAVPLFLLLTNFSISEAMGIALGAVAVSAVYGTLSGGRKTVLWVPALLLAGGGMLAAPLGRLAAAYVDDVYLLFGFSILAIVIAGRMWLQTKAHPEHSEIVRGTTGDESGKPSTLICRLSPSGQFQLKPRCLSGLLAGGVTVGFVSGLFGVGGGFLIVPLLIYLSQLNMRIAVSTSLFVIAMISSVGFASHIYLSESLAWQPLAVIFVAAIAGMMASQFFAKKIAGVTLQKIFAVSLFSVSIITLLGRLL